MFCELFIFSIISRIDFISIFCAYFFCGMRFSIRCKRFYLMRYRLQSVSNESQGFDIVRQSNRFFFGNVRDIDRVFGEKMSFCNRDILILIGVKPE